MGRHTGRQDDGTTRRPEAPGDGAVRSGSFLSARTVWQSRGGSEACRAFWRDAPFALRRFEETYARRVS